MRFKVEDNCIKDTQKNIEYKDLEQAVELLNKFNDIQDKLTELYIHLDMFKQVVVMDFTDVVKNIFEEQYDDVYKKCEKEILLNTKKERV